MRWLGALLILGAAGGGFILERERSMLPLRLAQALTVDLGILSAGICRSRRPLPELLERDLAQGPGNTALWGPLLVLLGEEMESSLSAGEGCVGGLPAPLGRYAGSVGAAAAGGRQNSGAGY